MGSSVFCLDIGGVGAFWFIADFAIAAAISAALLVTSSCHDSFLSLERCILDTSLVRLDDELCCPVVCTGSGKL